MGGGLTTVRLTGDGLADEDLYALMEVATLQSLHVGNPSGKISFMEGESQ